MPPAVRRRHVRQQQQHGRQQQLWQRFGQQRRPRRRRVGWPEDLLDLGGGDGTFLDLGDGPLLDLSGGETCDENVGTINMQVQSLNGSSGDLLQVRVSRYRVSYQRTDGGKLIPAPFVRSMDTLISVGVLAAGAAGSAMESARPVGLLAPPAAQHQVSRARVRRGAAGGGRRR